MKTNQVANTRAYRERKRREKGQTQVTVWVPESRASELKQIAKSFRDAESKSAQ